LNLLQGKFHIINKKRTFFKVKVDDLLKRVVDGDEDAFRHLYELTHKKVFFYLYRLLKDKEASEDIMVETFTEVWRGAKNFRDESSVSTWIIGIARNLAMNELKRTRRHEDIDNHPYIADGNITDTGAYDRRRLLRKALSNLSARHQEILNLVFYQEMDYLEVSRLLDIPVGTVKTRVFYAKKALLGILNQMGVKRDEI